MNPVKTLRSHLESKTSEFNNDSLASSDDKHDDPEGSILEESFEDIELIMNSSGVDQVKDLHDDEDIKHI
jgi:hypothetical protein